MAEFSPISENFTPEAPIEGVDWNEALKTPIPGYIDTDVSGSFSTDEPYTFPSTRGAAVSVQDQLSNITFVEGSSGQMSASIAYIRYWSRNGTTQRTSVAAAGTDNVVSDPQEDLLSRINSLSYGTDLNLGTAQPPVSPPRTAAATPTNIAYRRRPTQPVPTQTTAAPSNNNFLSRLGSIFSANPGGPPAPAWANPFYTPSAAPAPDNAVWQFLFNPEELQLSSGPDYNKAETWGVSDPANSGQPLSWRSNANRKLTFGKVLLHGYTFGKRVDSLERGLQQLFMTRDGEGMMDGPPVLEFVWGQRVFGPCVIRNIQVREKAWDKGLLVNAEVSFELEQVPEWTINDDFVDVFRPGRQPTVNDPLVTERTGDVPPPGGDEDKENKDQDGGGGGQPSPSNQDPNLCNFAVKQSSNFQTLFNRVDNPLTAAAFGDTKSIVTSFKNNKYQLYSGSSEIGKYVDSKLGAQSDGCKNNQYGYRVEILSREGGNFAISPEQNALQFIRKCTELTKRYIDEWQRTSPKCQAQRATGQRLAKERAQIEKCKKYTVGSPCSTVGERVSCATANGGRKVYCSRLQSNSPKWTLPG